MSVEDEIRELVAKLEKAKAAGAFRTFIDSIRFPNYRSLAKDATVNFGFPVTAFVGQNGTGKTSVIQALCGSPGGKSVEEFWFSTDVDPIKGEDPPVKGKRRKYEGVRPSLVYTYQKGGQIASVLKYRILKKGKPDYWEPARPGPLYGLKPLPSGKRHPTIEMDVVHRNFRYLPTSFDRCFHFLELSAVRYRLPKTVRSKIRTPQDYLRYKSKPLKRVLDTGLPRRSGKTILSDAPIELSGIELATIGRILGKSYSRGRVIDHRFFERPGQSVVFDTANREYSEAYAGSGESAVVSLVRSVLAAEDGTLVLLDEPEVSLHPGAQQQVLRFLLEQALHKKLQIAVSTHSPSMIRGLPRTAIKLFSESSDDGLVRVTEGLAPEEAFFAIGYPHSDRITVLVEDVLAKSLVEAVVSSFGPETVALFDVKFNPGGATAISRDIAYYSRHGAKLTFAILDGDQRIDDVFDPDQAKVTELTEENLGKEIQRAALQKISFDVDGKRGKGGDQQQRIDAQKEYLRFFRTHVFFLPKSKPEEIIWNEDAVGKYLSAPGLDATSILASLANETDMKKRFVAVAGHLTASCDVRAVQEFLVAFWKSTRPDTWTQLKATVELIRASYAGSN